MAWLPLIYQVTFVALCGFKHDTSHWYVDKISCLISALHRKKVLSVDVRRSWSYSLKATETVNHFNVALKSSTAAFVALLMIWYRTLLNVIFPIMHVALGDFVVSRELVSSSPSLSFVCCHLISANISNSAATALCKSHIILEDFFFFSFFCVIKMCCDASDGLPGVICVSLLFRFPVRQSNTNMLIFVLDVCKNCLRWYNYTREKREREQVEVLLRSHVQFLCFLLALSSASTLQPCMDVLRIYTNQERRTNPSKHANASRPST